MAEYIYKMPDIGEGVTEAEIVVWHVKVGDKVEEDAPICDAMTDKATVELTAPVAGTILEVGCAEGEIMAISGALAIFDTDGKSAPQEASKPAPKKEKAPKPKKPKSTKTFVEKLKDFSKKMRK